MKLRQLKTLIKLSNVHKLALNPNHVTFTVAGDITLDEIVSLLESKFGKWTSGSDTDLKNKAKGIYGKASNEEIKSLNEEGIETQTIPWIKDKEN